VKALLLPFAVTVASAQNGITFGPQDGSFQIDIRPSIEAVLWAGDTPAPALLDYDDSAFFAPRFSLEFDAAAGEHLTFHSMTRWDRGIDAGSAPDGELRLDEAFVRWRVCDDQRLNFQVGKYASFFGAWSGQHDFYDDPFLLAPLPYSQLIGVSPVDPASPLNTGGPGGGPGGPGGDPGGPGGPGGGAVPLSMQPKDQWSSMIWGPAYGIGAGAFGSTEQFDYAVEVKNSALSSHPDTWKELNFSHPTMTARVGYRPDATWAFGLSASRGAWPSVNAVGADRDDLTQTSLGLDARWARHDWIISGEVVLTEFETMSSGDLEAASWFVQARYKVSPGVWLAARLGQIFANDAVGPGGADFAWQSDVLRAELAAGWRIRPELLLKAGYTYTHTDDDPIAGEHLWGTGLGWRF
jgi:hypothetical protein